MKKSTQQDIFNNHIFRMFKDGESYDRLKFQLNRCREIMMKHKTFRSMPAIRQLEYCITICCIAIQSSTKDLRQFRLGADKKEVFKYSINEAYEEPDIISIDTEIKLLK